MHAVALDISFFNLKGGHSGVEIDKGRLNGIVGLATFLKQLSDDEINYELSSFEGGTASNAIPAKASVAIVVKSSDQEIVRKKVIEYCKTLSTKYQGIEENIRCGVKTLDELPQVITKEERDNAIKFIIEIIDGVYTMSKDMEGLVESSSNLGLFKISNGHIEFTSLIRSSSPEKEEELINAEIALAKSCGYSASSKKGSFAWPYDPNSKLVALTKKIYREQNNEEIKVSAVHAGLECGTFKKIKSDLDMISIGPDLKDGHTINETLYLNSIPRVWYLLEGLFAQYEK